MSIFLSNSQYRKVSTDSRKLKEGDIFLALKGVNFDGHDFLNQALKQGVELVFSEKEHEDPRVKVVNNCLETYHQLANEYRHMIKPITIAITGSAGKTTAKELLKSVLAQKYKVHTTEANFNNEIGVPKTILSMPEDTEVLILEMGMRGLGEIELLSKTAEPDIALITNIGTAHIERLGSKDNIRKAKLEIIKGIRSQGIGTRGKLIVGPDLYQSIKDEYQDLDIIQFPLTPSTYHLAPNCLISEGLIASANAVSKVAKLLKLNDAEIQAGLEQYQADPGRGKFIKKNGHLFIDESYNSNPEAVRNSVYAMLKQFPDNHKIALLGDINESNNELIEELFTELEQLENDKFKLLDARSIDANQAKKLLEQNLKDQSIVLVKASRAAKFELCITGNISHN